jgi:hypothetical protein
MLSNSEELTKALSAIGENFRKCERSLDEVRSSVRPILSRELEATNAELWKIQEGICEIAVKHGLKCKFRIASYASGAINKNNKKTKVVLSWSIKDARDSYAVSRANVKLKPIPEEDVNKLNEYIDSWYAAADRLVMLEAYSFVDGVNAHFYKIEALTKTLYKKGDE